MTDPRPASSAGTLPAPLFATTRWTLVLRSRGASEEARVALSELCEAYWRPVGEFIRRRCRNDDEARDRTQEFFARVLGGRGLDGAEPGRGRFRSYLLGAVKHFLADARDRDVAAKRGGGLEAEELDEAGIEGPAGELDVGFDRAWAVDLVNRAVRALASENQSAGRGQVFDVLKPWLLGEPAGSRQSEAAARLGWTENAVRVAVHRLRRRFRELVRAEIRQTVDSETEVQGEIRYLLEVLERSDKEGPR